VSGFNLLDRVDGRVLTTFVQTLRQLLQEGDETQRITGPSILCLAYSPFIPVITICVSGLVILSRFAGISLSSLELLFAESSREEPLYAVWLSLLRSSSKPELIAAVLQGVTAVLDRADSALLTVGAPSNVFVSFGAAEQKVADSQEHIQRVAALKKRLFLEVGPARSSSLTTVQYLLTLAKQPVGTTRHAAMDLMRATAGQSWGLAMLFQGM